MALEDGRNSKSLLKEVELEPDVLSNFRGSDKEVAFEAWVNANYPGYVYAKNSGTIKQPEDVGSKPKTKESTEKKSNKFLPTSKATRNKSFVSNNESKLRNEKQKIELRKLRRDERNERIRSLKSSYQDKKGFIFYLALFWLYMDTPLKKIIAVFIPILAFTSGYQYLEDKLSYDTDYETYKTEKHRIVNMELKVDSLIQLKQDEGILQQIDELRFNGKIENQFLKDSVKNFEKYLYKKRNELKDRIKSN